MARPSRKVSEFNQALWPMIIRIITNLAESRPLAALREALLPELLSGELRVKRRN